MIHPIALKSTIVRDIHPELPLDPDAVQPGIYKWPPHLLPSLQLVVFIGGCFGTLARYSIGNFMPTINNGWPYSTFIINLLGALLLGTLLEQLTRRGSDGDRRQKLRLGLGTGFLGAFTTYSTLSVEVVLLSRNNEFSMAILYAAISIIGGVLFSALGIFIASNHSKRKSDVI